ncbi:MAG: hypothetical protein ACNA8W_17520, partial [Bradymonadaceae bacterium]
RTPVFELGIQQSRRAWDSWLARIDGLNNGLATVCDAVFGRFFASEDHAFARTLTFRVRKKDYEKLRAFYEDELFSLITSLDEACVQPDDAEPMSLSIFWTPHQLIESTEEEKK